MIEFFVGNAELNFARSQEDKDDEISSEMRGALHLVKVTKHFIPRAKHPRNSSSEYLTDE